MNENKRFSLKYEQGNWWAVCDGDITLWKEEVIHLLNEFDEKVDDLINENELLKTEKSIKNKKEVCVLICTKKCIKHC